VAAGAETAIIVSPDFNLESVSRGPTVALGRGRRRRRPHREQSGKERRGGKEQRRKDRRINRGRQKEETRRGVLVVMMDSSRGQKTKPLGGLKGDEGGASAEFAGQAGPPSFAHHVTVADDVIDDCVVEEGQWASRIMVVCVDRLRGKMGWTASCRE
jgi:hypothetical protein